MKNNKQLILIVISTIVIVLGIWLWAYYSLIDWDKADRGTFGDMFGGVNALFSGLAFAGIIITIILQSNELNLQRKELISTREEFETQNETLKIQRFENTFFQMLEFHHQIVNNLFIKRANYKINDSFFGDYYGREYLRGVGLNMIDEMRKKGVNIHESLAIYNSFFDTESHNLAHYFRNLYRIFKYVDDAKIFEDKKNDNDKEFNFKYTYTSIVRAQLSDTEMIWLFYNCLSDFGGKKFKPLIEKYAIFNNLNEHTLAFSEHHTFYKETAYILNNK